MRPGAGQIVLGVLILLAGIGITVATYSAARGGGRYMVMNGLIGVGVITTIRGIIRAARDGT